MRIETTAAALLLAFGAAAPAYAQQAAAAPSAAAEMGTADTVRQALRSDGKRALVEKNMELTPAEAKKFWPVYDQYQKDLDRILRRQNRAMNDYIAAESSMTDANAKRLASDLVAADGEEQRLREATLKKLLKALPGRKAARYMQLENKFRSVIRYDIADHIPLVR
ncbi:MAG TPA: hypothetical protein VLT89_11690 [Usitatibacter sp.]|nr:hypothetical protein [Usitatibacter sp.]